jgi:hypothetical protein
MKLPSRLSNQKEAVMELDIKKGLQTLHCFDYDHMLDHRDGIGTTDSLDDEFNAWLNGLETNDVWIDTIFRKYEEAVV